MDATIVFQTIWNAINAVDENGNRKYRYFVLEGSSRSSKTYSLLQCFYCYSWRFGNKRLSAWRDTKKDCKDTVLNDMTKAFRKFPDYKKLNFHKTESVYTFPTDTKIEIQGTDDAVKVHGFEGDVTWLNEPYKISKDVFDQLDMRTIDFVVIDWNPKQAHWIDDLKKDPRTFTLHSTFRDNPFCPPEQRRKILSYQPVKMADVVVSGLLSEGDARNYDIIANKLCLTNKQIKELSRCKENENKGSASEFNWMVYGLGLKAEKPNRIFRWKRIPDHEYHAIDAPIYDGVDWGVVDPMGILEAKYYDGTLYLHQKGYSSENILRERLTPTQRAQIDNMDEGLIVWYFNQLAIPKDRIIVCDNNRVLKIRALRAVGWEYAIAAVKGAGSVVDGINLLNNIKVCYTESSKDLEYEQENYSRQVDRYGIVLEEPEDTNNHLMDPARYVAEFLRSQGIINAV